MFTTTQLKRAAAIAEQIENLQAELNSVLGTFAKVSNASSVAVAAPAPKGKRGGKRFVSAEARAKMAASQKARWAKRNGGASAAPVASAPAKATKGISAEGRARLAAAMKARWDARKTGAPAPTSPSKAVAKPAKTAKKGKRNISPEARAKMADAARRRWANVQKSK